MQVINTVEWAEITGLSEGNIYFIQANDDDREKMNLIDCYWAQQETKPVDLNTDAVLGHSVKIKAGVPVYVKSYTLPVSVNVLKVE